MLPMLLVSAVTRAAQFNSSTAKQHGRDCHHAHTHTQVQVAVLVSTDSFLGNAQTGKSACC